MPMDWASALKKYSFDTLDKHGYGPYNVVMSLEKLTNAFKSKNKDSILFYAADLGHYVGDLHVPLHITNNYDGQLSGQKECIVYGNLLFLVCVLINTNCIIRIKRSI